ncbi:MULTISPECIES: UDP-N-acetylmuramate--L-alanine ligase [Candidatus Ichthyocystis]|uniref:UDP-N-acetylmuramate--L-alanine ligase n=1 Tax=Candidatus Ichthyocystis TaxID=2929841 RepID=UPI000A565653|nr:MULTISPECIES: UDP-N-acetylmuramate--L-alanine ligase [Ichthyocystis]
MKRKIDHIHFVGIGGSGMSGIAEVLIQSGYKVSGSDIISSATTERLSQLGADIFIGHSASNISRAQVIVQSSAIGDDNVELVEGHRKSIPVIPRAKMLADLMRLKRGIAVGGSHGKTTTTSLIASILDHSGKDPTYVIGGCLLGFEHGSSLGRGEYIVVEADESDKTFLLFSPVINVVTNIDLDHMQTYDYDLNNLKQAFLEFIENIPFYGFSFLCNEDPNIRSMLKHITRPFFKYGFSADSDIRAIDCSVDFSSSSFVVEQDGFSPLAIKTSLIGEHNILNCLASIGVCRQLGVYEDYISDALVNFSGVSRRFQRCDDVCLYGCSCSLVDDYGHHPSEIVVTTNAVRQVFKNRRIVLIFQPHRFTRTRDLFNQFVDTLSHFDELILLPVYAAGEKSIDTECLSKKLVKSIATRNSQLNPYFVEDINDVCVVLKEVIRDKDVVMIMGAGSISELFPFILSGLRNDKKS